MSDAPEDGRRSLRKGCDKHQLEQEAAKQGLTAEEYGVHKGSTGSAVKPISSAGGKTLEHPTRRSMARD